MSPPSPPEVRNRDRLPQRSELWRHHTGATYEIVELVVEERSGCLEVVYRSDAGGPAFTRALGDFLGLVVEGEHAGEWRFRPLGEPLADTTEDLVQDIVDRIES